MIHGLVDLYRTLTTPEKLSQFLGSMLTGWLGYALLFGVVYSETGLLVGFFLPGDSFLFTVGVVAGLYKSLSIVVVNLILMSAALLGDSTGYLLGRRTGPAIFSRKDSRFFKQAYVARTHSYYQRYGGKTIIIARFVPIVRTFAAFMAGVGQMPYLSFLPFSVCGGMGWVFLMTMLGYSLGGVPIVKQNFEKVVFLIIFLSLVPTFVEVYRARRGH